MEATLASWVSQHTNIAATSDESPCAPALGDAGRHHGRGRPPGSIGAECEFDQRIGWSMRVGSTHAQRFKAASIGLVRLAGRGPATPVLNTTLLTRLHLQVCPPPGWKIGLKILTGLPLHQLALSTPRCCQECAPCRSLAACCCSVRSWVSCHLLRARVPSRGWRC